jgi:hypothetical protein
MFRELDFISAQTVWEQEAQAPCLPPWQAEPYRLWSLIDMAQRFRAASVSASLGDLRHAITALAAAPLIGSPTADEHFWKGLLSALEGVERSFSEFPVSRAGMSRPLLKFGGGSVEILRDVGD